MGTRPLDGGITMPSFPSLGSATRSFEDITFTAEELQLLADIIAQPNAEGAFAGMIFNNVHGVDFDDAQLITQTIKDALRVRVLVRRISRETRYT